MGSPDPRRRAQGAHLDVIQLCAKPRRAWGTRSRARELYLRACLRGERRERAASNLRINHARARCANRLPQKCPQNMYTRAPLSRRHYLKVAKKSDGGVFFKLHAAPPRTWGGCAAREGGGLAGWKCARRAACGAPGGLCTRSTSRMVVGQAPVAARGALRALKPRAAPWRRGEGSVARAWI